MRGEDPMPDMKFSVGDQSFVYDYEKGLMNRQKHGISFETAAYVFLDNLRLDFEDDLHSTVDEIRWITIGLVRDILTVVYCERSEDGKDYCRLISARQATPSERKLYNDAMFGRN